MSKLIIGEHAFSIEKTTHNLTNLEGIKKIFEAERDKIKKVIKGMTYQMLFETGTPKYDSQNIFQSLSEQNRKNLDIRGELMKLYRKEASFSP